MEQVMGIKSFIEPVASVLFGEKVGSYAGSMFGPSASKKAYKLQRKLLRNQIPDLVAGATAAGLHPLAALGVNPASSPVSASVGDSGDHLSSMGSGISEYMKNIESPEEKAANQLLFRKAELELDLLGAQIASEKARTAQTLSPGVGSSGPVTIDTPFGPFKFLHGDTAQKAENAGGEGANWLFGGLNTADSARAQFLGDPEANIAREIQQIVGADIWAQARSDLAKTWARGVDDINRMYEPGGFWKALGY